MPDQAAAEPESEAPTFPRPPERIELPLGRALVRCRVGRTATTVQAINASIDHLRPWMAWAAEPATEVGIGAFLAAAELLWDEGRDFGYSIIERSGADELVIGGAGLHGRLGPRGLEIGYWVHVDRVGQGIATDLARALTAAAFAMDGIDRVRIQCEVDNVRSARVPEKLGYALAEVTVPDDGPCADRRTQVWLVERADWMPTRGGDPS